MLCRAGANVVAYDPLANGPAREQLAGEAVVHDSLAVRLEDAEVVLIATPDPQFRKIAAKDFPANGCRRTVVDFWRILDGRLSSAPHIDYVAFGRGNCSPEESETLAALWDGVRTASTAD